MESGAQPGNQNAMKWPTPEERQAAGQRLAAHLRTGLSLQSWGEADEETIKRYMADFSLDFGTEDIRAAMRESRQLWEKVGLNGTLGKIKNFNAASWKFNMQNRFKWKDSVQLSDDPENPTSPKKVEITVVRAVKATQSATGSPDEPRDS